MKSARWASSCRWLGTAIIQALVKQLGASLEIASGESGMLVNNVSFFCAGWDLKAAAGGDAVDGDYGVGGFAGLQELSDMNKPLIACVNGMAVGGGFELALSCDLIYASDHSSFALPEIRAGTLADAATIKLPKRIPYHIAMELLFTGRWMDAAEGASLGAGQRSVAGGSSRNPRLGDRTTPGIGTAVRLRRDQGNGAGGRVAYIPRRDEQGYAPAAADRRPALRLRG